MEEIDLEVNENIFYKDPFPCGKKEGCNVSQNPEEPKHKLICLIAKFLKNCEEPYIRIDSLCKHLNKLYNLPTYNLVFEIRSAVSNQDEKIKAFKVVITKANFCILQEKVHYSVIQKERPSTSSSSQQRDEVSSNFTLSDLLNPVQRQTDEESANIVSKVLTNLYELKLLATLRQYHFANYEMHGWINRLQALRRRCREVSANIRANNAWQRRH